MNKDAYIKWHADACEKMKAITLAKNSDYTGATDDPFANFRRCEQLGIATVEQGFLTRMTDKLARITSLTVHKTDQKVKDEAIQDTLFDLANYAILMAGYLVSKQAPIARSEVVLAGGYLASSGLMVPTMEEVRQANSHPSTCTCLRCSPIPKDKG